MKIIKQSESLSDYWRHHIQSWQQTNTDQSSYCRTHDLNFHRFTYWRRKLIASGSDTRKIVLRSGFVPVKAVPPVVSSNLTATLPNGVVLQGIATDNLSPIMRAARSSGGCLKRRIT